MLKTKGASRAQKFGFAPYLRPKGGPSGRSAQVERTLSHEQNRLMRTKEHSAPGKTALVVLHRVILKSFFVRGKLEVDNLNDSD